ncbi:MAG: hypothetical protein LH615_14595 [Ferruginibacter sp.]|nr:hypothetical protein [Ferruginibacter sp.]
MNIIIKKIRIMLLITITLSFLGFSCNRDTTRPCANSTAYSFKVTADWTPQQEVYNIGDTIFLNSEFPKILTDYTTINSQQINYGNSIGIAGNLSTGQIDTVSHKVLSAASKFSYISYIGITTDISGTPENGKNILFAEQANTYKFKLGLIVKQKGIFLLGIPNLLSQGIINENCTNASFEMSVTNSDKHISLYQYALGFPPDADALKRIYCFRVQ